MTEERKATAEDIRRMQEQLAQTPNDPNLVISCGCHFPLPPFDMEDVLSLYVESSNLIEKRLAKSGIKLTPEQEDEMHDAIWPFLENLSSGTYRNHN